MQDIIGPVHVCVSFTFKASFLPVDIQHNQCPCRFFYRGDMKSSVDTKLRQIRYYIGTRYAVSTAVDNAIPWHHAGYDRHDIPGTWYEFMKEKNLKNEQNKQKQKTNQKERRKLSFLLAGDVADT